MLIFVKLMTWFFFSDCGAGIGRVSKRLLLPLFNTVDMEEQNPAFLKKAEEYLVSVLLCSSLRYSMCIYIVYLFMEFWSAGNDLKCAYIICLC